MPTSHNWRKRCPERKSTGAAAITHAHLNEEDWKLLLASVDKLPYTGALCASRSRSVRLSSYNGYVGDTAEEALRDSRCNSAAVKRSLVRSDHMTRKIGDCVLTDNTVKHFPRARINVGTPFYTGELDVMIMNDPVFF